MWLIIKQEAHEVKFKDNMKILCFQPELAKKMSSFLSENCLNTSTHSV